MTSTSFLAPVLQSVLEAVWEAAGCCERIAEDFQKQDHHTKDDASPVTIADYCSQALILQRLADITPDIGVVAEEQGGELRERPDMCARVAAFAQSVDPALTAERIPDLLDRGNHPGGDTGTFWTLDPIDGTKGYLRGGQYAIALALIENGRPVFGVLGCPRYAADDSGRTGVVFYGGESLAAAMVTAPGAKPRAVHVSEALQTCDAKLCESVESGHTSHDRSAQLIEKLGLSKEVVRMDSQAKYAAVAHGAAGVYMRLPVKKGYREKIWDHAAGVAVIQAAGGKVTDLNGKALDFGQGETLKNNRGVLATNGALHPPALAVLKTITPGGIGLGINPMHPDEFYMDMAMREAHRAGQAGEVPVGAVLVHPERGIVGKAHNQVETLKDATAHAEILAITQASASLEDWRLEDCTLYVTKEPCPMCAGAIVFSRVRRVVWGLTDTKRGGESRFGILTSPDTCHRPEILSGWMEEPCKQQFLGFFKAVRNHEVGKPGAGVPPS